MKGVTSFHRGISLYYRVSGPSAKALLAFKHLPDTVTRWPLLPAPVDRDLYRTFGNGQQNELSGS
ncbi:hypothetical protein KCP74_16715 [Salmonella enterica subsp. enterica]|nr:hypothetical protein KCP74_16715 [Salmonella enterica subsp. enterica]